MLWVQFSHTDHWMFNIAPHGKELSEDLRIIIVALHKDGLDYKKFSNSLERSYSTVARVIQRLSKTGKEVESLCCVSGAEAGFKKQTHKCCQHCFRGRRSGISLTVLRPYTIHCNKSVCMTVVPEGSLFWSWLTKKPANSLLKTTWPRAWITGTMSSGLMRLR